MLAHNKELLENTFFIAQAETLRDGGFITSDQFLNEKKQTAVLKSQPNYLIRAGFFVLGILLCAAVCGFLSLLFGEAAGFKVLAFGYAMIAFAGTEWTARQDYYNYGLDDAFVLGFLAMTGVAVGISTESTTAVFIVLAFSGLLCAIRYVNTLAALVSMVGVVGFFCCLVLDLKIIPKVYLPFIGLLLAGIFYWMYWRLVKTKEALLYQFPLQMVEVFSLLLGYASINYYVVRELSVELMHVEVTPKNDIPFAAVFYILTFAVPIVYLFRGIKTKNRSILIIGALCLVCSFLTIRYYYSIMPAELALILSGAILFALSLLLIRKLRNKESGITFERDRISDSNALLYAQIAISNSQVSIKVETRETGNMPFGGGGFSGGGSSESY